MKEHEEEDNDGSLWWMSIPKYLQWSINKHMKSAHVIKVHETNESSQCTQCLVEFKTKTELFSNLKENHYNYKPCDYYNGPNNEDNCEIDGECRFYKTRLKP